jgi:CheY-like chemotaxis protein
VVGTAGLEPATSASRTLRATKLRYVPIVDDVRPNPRVLDMALLFPPVVRTAQGFASLIEAWGTTVTAGYISSMQLLLVADAVWVRNDVAAALPSSDWAIHHADPHVVVEAAVKHPPTAVVVDMQVGSMGGMAVIRNLREAMSMGILPTAPLILLLDRTADRFIAKRSGADRSLVKPFTAQEMRKALAFS